jgi:tRNA-specific 2-thiouridylase
MLKKKKKILVAISGGVDSSVAAKLLKNQGHDVTGVFLFFWKDDKEENKASSQSAFLDAQAVAKKIGVSFISLDYAKEFKKDVVDYFLAEYEAGRTPNPCVVCNKQVKLGLLLKYVQANGYDALATGHYLKRLEKNGEVRIYKAKDDKKDQSYFLYTLERDELKQLYFPLGNYNKPRVRELAKEFGLSIASKADSQDICFLNGPHNNFLKKHLKLAPGEIKRQEDGKIVGQHQGLALYTIGQRRGIEVGGTGPYYVAEMDYNKNILWVVRTWNDDLLYRRDFSIKNVTWLSKKPPVMPYRCRVVIRYRHPVISCLVTKGKNRQTLNVKLRSNTRAITSGQSAVFYQGQRLLGGGVIV